VRGRPVESAERAPPVSGPRRSVLIASGWATAPPVPSDSSPGLDLIEQPYARAPRMRDSCTAWRHCDLETGYAPPVKRLAAVAVPLVALIVFAAPSLAHRRATQAERRAIIAAVVRQGQLSKAQAACQIVTISTVNTHWAKLSWPAKLTKACLHVAANGIIIEHRTTGGWRFVTVGSSIACPITGMPAKVARDLSACH